MRKFKNPLRIGFGLTRTCKNSIYDFISVINDDIYNELIKYDGVYNQETDAYKLMEFIGKRIYQAFSGN